MSLVSQHVAINIEGKVKICILHNWSVFVLFVGLTVQPCGEPCASVAGFEFLAVKVR